MQSPFHATVTSTASPALAASAARPELLPQLSTLRSSYAKVRHATECLCEPLAIEDYVVQSLPDASPVKWHLAHTSLFFEQFVLEPLLPTYRAFDPDYRELFGGGPSARAPGRVRTRALSRPTVEQTFAYRSYVDQHMDSLLGSQPESEELGRRVTLGLHREQQHQEMLLLDLKHAFSLNPLTPIYTDYRADAPAEAPALEFLDYEASSVEVGHGGRGFSFDNELPRHTVVLPAFRLANRLITNAEYRGFVSCGAYTRAEYWLADGWECLQRQGWERPLYWDAALECEFTLGGVQRIDPHAPVAHLSFYEADAFARWVGARLPTEFEWEAAARVHPVQGNFLEERNWRPLPAIRGSEPMQLFGDAWEWTRSAYAPYPRHAVPQGPLAELYGAFPVNRMVLRGGSCLTPRSHVRPSCRRDLRADARWQLTGLRLALDD